MILTTSGQVSVYAPRSDPYMKPWDEVGDCLRTRLAALTYPDSGFNIYRQDTVALVSNGNGITDLGDATIASYLSV